MSAYNIDYTIDLMDAFEQLETDRDKKDFILEAIESLGNKYNDDLDVVTDAATNLIETQQEDLVKEVFDYLTSHRVTLVEELLDSMPEDERQQIREWLKTEEE